MSSISSSDDQKDEEQDQVDKEIALVGEEDIMHSLMDMDR